MSSDSFDSYDFVYDDVFIDSDGSFSQGSPGPVTPMMSTSDLFDLLSSDTGLEKEFFLSSDPIWDSDEECAAFDELNFHGVSLPVTPDQSLPGTPDALSSDEQDGGSSDDGGGQSPPARRRRLNPPAQRERGQVHRAPPSLLRGNILQNSLLRASTPIEAFCCVCCRLLPSEDVHLLENSGGFELDTVPWPCRQYDREPTRKNDRLTACKSHKVLNQKALDFVRAFFFVCNEKKTRSAHVFIFSQVINEIKKKKKKKIDFINRLWPNPLYKAAEGGVPGHVAPYPQVLEELQYSDIPYISLVTAFVNFRQESGSYAQFPHVNGRVSIYESRQRLSHHDGMTSFLQDRTVPPRDKDRIMAAWQWLVASDPLYGGVNDRRRPDILEPVRVDKLVQDPKHVEGERQDFTADVLLALDPGPRAADVRLEDVVVGLDQNQQRVTYLRPLLLATLFPELYPYGSGCFELWHHKINLRAAADQHLGSHTIREYAKYRLLHFDRKFAKNQRFIVFIFDWINKNTYHGYRRRSAPALRPDGQPTRVENILRGNTA